jgi:hypothetical protein
MKNLINNYNDALNAIYEHVGFKEDWVICPIDDCTERYWYTDYENFVRHAVSIDQFFSNGDYYRDDIYRQRFYDKWVYEGEDFTMIFCDPHVDNMKWFRVFDNKKRIRTLNKELYLRKSKLEQLNLK